MEPRGCSAQHIITHGRGDPPAPVSTKATGWKFHSGRHRWVNCMVCGSKDGEKTGGNGGPRSSEFPNHMRHHQGGSGPKKNELIAHFIPCIGI